MDDPLARKMRAQLREHPHSESWVLLHGLGRRLYNQLEAKLDGQLHDQLRSELEGPLYDQLRMQTFRLLYIQLWDK